MTRPLLRSLLAIAIELGLVAGCCCLDRRAPVVPAAHAAGGAHAEPAGS